MEKTQGFYQLDNTSLGFDVIKDIEKIQLNHFLMQKENFTRLKGDLPKGYFNTSIHEVSEKLNITKNKATRLLKEFIDLEIITMVKRGTSKNTLSIYKYNAVTTTEELPVEVQPTNKTKASNTNASDSSDVNNKANNDTDKTAEVVATTTEATTVATATKETQETANADKIDAPDYFDYNFNECGLMKKLDICEKKGLVLNCDKDDQKAMDTIKGMDEFLLNTCLDVAYLEDKLTVSYLLGIYHNKGGVVDREREKFFYEQELAEQKRRIRERRLQEELKAQAEADAQEVVQEDVQTNDIQDVKDDVETTTEQSTDYPIDENTGLPVYPNTSPNFNFTRDFLAYNTYLDIVSGKSNLLDSNVELARHYAKYYNVATDLIDQAYAEGRVVSRG